MKIVEQDFLDLNEHFNLMHPVVRPTEVRDGDPVKCFKSVGSKSLEIRLWSYCPFGFEYKGNQTSDEHVGAQHEFKLHFGKDFFSVVGTVVYVRSDDHHAESLVGVRIHFQSIKSDGGGLEKRKSNRWMTPTHLLPTGTASNPVRYNDYIFFRITDVSASGVKILTSLRNKFVAVGQILESTVSVPMIGTMCVRLRISRCGVEEVDGKPYLALGASFVSPDPMILRTLSEYLLTFVENCSVVSLRSAGFDLSPSFHGFDFSYVKSKQDYEEVLDLRFKSYSQSGKLDSSLSRDFMCDEFDSRSRILIAKVNGKIVGSARAMFHEAGDRTSHERYMKYPAEFPAVTECLEVSRVCILPEFQGMGLANELGKHLALLTVKSGRKYCYLSAAGTLISFWKKLGFQGAGVTYSHPNFGELPHELLINDMELAVIGRNVSTSVWVNTYADLYEYCSTFGLISPSAVDEVRAKCRSFTRIFRR